MIKKEENSIICRFGHETVRIDAWGRGIRVRAVPCGELPDIPWALSSRLPSPDARIYDGADGGAPFVEVSGLRCEVRGDRLSFLSGDRLLFEEAELPWSLRDRTRAYKTLPGSDTFSVDIKFAAYDGEHLHGMGQYRGARHELKGSTLELAHRNSQISVPFLLSSRGYGFLWNNPAVGRATFASNMTVWHADATRAVDFWVAAGETPAEILEKYADAVGHASPLPENLLGLWQCKLRYRTQDELLEAAREYRRRGIKLDVIVVDFFHWIYQGDWDFDPEYWPDPQAMVDELSAMGTRLMVSVWPTVDPRSKNHRGFAENGYLIRTERGLPAVMEFYGNVGIYDATDPGAREFAYGVLRENYGRYGIDKFWLDEAEPEYSVTDFDHYRLHSGPALVTGNIYPLMHSKMVYDGQKKDGVPDILNLVRCAWVGSQKYGALVWSGDIESSFREMKAQIHNMLNMGAAGIPWWISDVGGFYGGDVRDPVFRELLVRWFEWAVYTPVLRMHGDRQPGKGPLVHGTEKGGGFCPSGADNELWVYGEEIYNILLENLERREKLRPYIKKAAEETVKTGLPLMRAMYMEFPDDEECWLLDDEYMFGGELLVAPVSDYGARERRVYLPRGRWESGDDGAVIESTGEYVTANAPLGYTPVFRRL